MAKETYPTNFPLKHQQKDMRLALELADSFKIDCPTFKSADDQYRKVLDTHGDEDFCAVYEAYKPQVKRAKKE